MPRKSSRQSNASQEGPRAAAHAETPEHLEQVRAILFGQQFAEFDDRLKQLEQGLLAEHAALRDATMRWFDELVAKMDEQDGAVRQALADRENAHERAVENLTRELERSVTATQERLTEIRQDADRRAGELRRETASRVEALAARLTDQSSALSALVDERLAELRALTADRESLAALFEEMAARLRRPSSG